MGLTYTSAGECGYLSEGFDCPDVEFVQLARPTLSLAKYLQMVGRGLRVAKGKKNCVIIDNVDYIGYLGCHRKYGTGRLHLKEG